MKGYEEKVREERVRGYKDKGSYEEKGRYEGKKRG